MRVRVTKGDTVPYRSKLVLSALDEAAAGYVADSGSRAAFSFIGNDGLASDPGGRPRPSRGLANDVSAAAEALSELVAEIDNVTAGSVGDIHTSVAVRRAIKSAKISYYSVSHRMMRGIMSISNRDFVMVASLYNDISTLRKVMNAVRYGDTSRDVADAVAARTVRRIVKKAARVAEIYADYSRMVSGGELPDMEHSVMAYRYRNRFFVNADLLLECLGIDASTPKHEIARAVRSMQDGVHEILYAIEESDSLGAGSVASGHSLNA